MKKVILITFLIFLCFELFSQAEWQFTTEIKRNNHYLLEGIIAEKYPITMYLEENGFFCNFENRWNYSYGIKGWYYYNNIKKKIPLLGSVEYRENEYSVKLFVPINTLDTINRKTCEIENYREVFIADECCSFTSMKWKMTNKKDWSDVSLKLIEAINYETDVKIKLEINNMEFFSFNLSNATENKYIDTVNFLSSKTYNNNFYLIFSFEHMRSESTRLNSSH